MKDWRSKKMDKMTKNSVMWRKVLGGVLTLGMVGGMALTTSAAAPPQDHNRGGQHSSEGRGANVAQDRGRSITPDRGRADQGRVDQGRGSQARGDQGRGFQGRGDQGRGDHGRVDQGRGDQGRFNGSRDGDRNHGDQDRGVDRDRFVVRTYVPYAAPINVGAIAQQNGYRDGFAAGQYDAYHGFSGDCDDNPQFRNAMAGYVGTYGASGFYQTNYRIGFQNGYNDGLNSVR